MWLKGCKGSRWQRDKRSGNLWLHPLSSHRQVKPGQSFQSTNCLASHFCPHPALFFRSLEILFSHTASLLTFLQPGSHTARPPYSPGPYRPISLGRWGHIRIYIGSSYNMVHTLKYIVILTAIQYGTLKKGRHEHSLHLAFKCCCQNTA